MLDPKEILEHHIDYPKINAKNRRSLGAFIIAWGVLEGELDTCFISLFRVNPTLCGCVTANLGTKAKLDILSSALSMLEEPLGSDLVTAGHKIVEDTRYYSAMARNTLAHGQLNGRTRTGKLEAPPWCKGCIERRKVYNLLK